MNAFELLKTDHKKVARLFDKMESARGKAKLALFQQIKTELELHTHIEEKIFYPALETPEETHDLTLEAYEEHKVVKTLLAELSSAKSADDEWQAKAKVLRENVEHHVKEEENELFDNANDALSDKQIEALGVKMEAEKARKQGKPSPKPTVAKVAKSSNANPGLLSRIAGLVGLGTDTGNKKAAKKAPAKKKASSKKASKAAKPASRSKRRSSASTVATTRSSADIGLKKAPAARPSSASKTKTSARRGKKTAKKSGGRK